MAWGNSKGEMIVAENAAMKTEIKMLRERLEELKEESRQLRESLRYAWDALAAKESPEAYRDRKYAEDLAASQGMGAAVSEEWQETARKIPTLSKLAQEQEQPLFRDADDMVEQLSKVMGLPIVRTESLHGNSES